MNFLKSIAKTKVFDRPRGNMDSIEAARAAKLFKVLMYASEEKDYNNATAADMKAEQQRNR